MTTPWKPQRVWTPHQQIDMGNGSMGTRLAVKRACDGPHGADGYLLGDPTEIEMAAVTRPRPQSLNSVTGDCGLCRGFHVVFANPERRPFDWRERDGDTLTIEVLCPGTIHDGEKVPRCASYEPCGCPPPNKDELTAEYQAFIEQPCPRSPTGVHVYDSELGEVAVPTGGCWYQHDRAAEVLAEVVKEPGMYPVNVSADDTLPVYERADLRRLETAPALVV